jgi:NTP pyrophosphatase (non-canonical NTP hydrolase)
VGIHGGGCQSLFRNRHRYHHLHEVDQVSKATEIKRKEYWKQQLAKNATQQRPTGRNKMDIFDLHKKMTSHLFPAFSSTDERFLTLAISGEAGELANLIKKRWRDNANLFEEIRDEIADIRVYLELIAKCFSIEGSKLQDASNHIFATLPDRDSSDERFISLALCNRIGMLGSIIETRWRTNSTTMDNMACNLLAEIRCYLEIMAILFDIEGSKLNFRVEQKLAKVVQKHGIKMDEEKARDDQNKNVI